LDQFDLWTLTLHTLSALIYESSETELAWSQALRRSLSEVDATLKFPPKFRWRIEQVLPFLERRDQFIFNPNSARMVIPPNIDPWLMLEDQDESVVLKALGAKVVDKKELTVVQRLV